MHIGTDTNGDHTHDLGICPPSAATCTAQKMSLTPSEATEPPETPTPPALDIEATKEQVLRIYKEVWDEFRRWKVDDCRQQLLLLQRPLPPPGREDPWTDSAPRAGEPSVVEVSYLVSTDEDEDDDDDVPIDEALRHTCKTVTPWSEGVFTPHPRYEACTPSVQNIAARVGSAAHAEFYVAPFIPYVDDPKFDPSPWLMQFDRFAWEELGNPDVEVIQFETLRRLHFDTGLSLEDIDATDTLPLSRIGNRDGLIYQMTQRDELYWTGLMSDLTIGGDGAQPRRIDPRAFEPHIDDLRGRLESIVPYFCANPTCIQVFCPQHIQEFPPIPPAVPRVTSDEYPDGAPCGDACFREIDDDFPEDSVQWEEPDVDELSCILEIMPDTVPCGLAKLVRRPCREVFVQRQRLLPDEKIYPETRKPLTAAEKAGFVDVVHSAAELDVPSMPCSHTGPCDINNPDCSCAVYSAHCQHNCRCSLTCKRRWGGCQCKPKKPGSQKTCLTDTCRCRKRGSECDPMVCGCDVIKHSGNRKWQRGSKESRQLRPDGKHSCQNSDIQRGKAAELEVKRGAFGLGTFAVKSIPRGGFIGEYVGELEAASDDKREVLRKHLGLNYNFGLGADYNIDSARVGNETRYINHAPQAVANAEAATRLVFGEKRIALFAKSGRHIKAGEEIRFDYGEVYWNN
ncbi:hypothetical protein BC834DRAFT_604325 [Gloeopeniophorella convolvens]|nr:hypothetical protein BC834DRAFT_604325 [Gloeopeniophorella convolvens]